MGAKSQTDRARALRTQGSPVVNEITASETIGVDDTLNEVTVPAAGSITVTLPSVQAARGKFYQFDCVADGGGTGVLVQDQDDAIVAAANYLSAGNGMTAVGDHILLYCTGKRYIQIDATLT